MLQTKIDIIGISVSVEPCSESTIPYQYIILFITWPSLGHLAPFLREVDICAHFYFLIIQQILQNICKYYIKYRCVEDICPRIPGTTFQYCFRPRER